MESEEDWKRAIRERLSQTARRGPLSTDQPGEKAQSFPPWRLILKDTEGHCRPLGGQSWLFSGGFAVMGKGHLPPGYSRCWSKCYVASNFIRWVCFKDFLEGAALFVSA